MPSLADLYRRIKDSWDEKGGPGAGAQTATHSAATGKKHVITRVVVSSDLVSVVQVKVAATVRCEFDISAGSPESVPLLITGEVNQAVSVVVASGTAKANAHIEGFSVNG